MKGTVVFPTVHKSISRHMYLRPKIDSIKAYQEEYYGTGIGDSLCLFYKQLI